MTLKTPDEIALWIRVYSAAISSTPLTNSNEGGICVAAQTRADKAVECFRYRARRGARNEVTQ